jgi:hypothetical protein
VDYEDRVVRIEHEDDLHEPPATPSTLNEVFVITYLLGKRWPSLPDDLFRFLPVHAMFGDVVSVPTNPPKLHGNPLEWIVT